MRQIDLSLKVDRNVYQNHVKTGLAKFADVSRQTALPAPIHTSARRETARATDSALLRQKDS